MGVVIKRCAMCVNIGTMCIDILQLQVESQVHARAPACSCTGAINCDRSRLGNSIGCPRSCINAKETNAHR